MRIITTQAFWKSVSIIFFTALMFGCTTSNVYRKSNFPIPEKQIASAKVVWLPKTKMQYRINKVSSIYNSTISEKDRDDASESVGKLLKHFDENVVKSFEVALSARGVVQGGEYVIELSPIEGSYVADNQRSDSRGISIWVAVKIPNASESKWWIATTTKGPVWQSEQSHLENFIASAIGEMVEAGWVK